MQKEVTDGADVLLHRLTTGQCTAWFCVTWFGRTNTNTQLVERFHPLLSCRPRCDPFSNIFFFIITVEMYLIDFHTVCVFHNSVFFMCSESVPQ